MKQDISKNKIKKVSVCIVNCNTKDLLKDCLSSVISYTRVDYEIIVVDNGSKDGSIEMVKDNFGHVNLILNKENLGFTKANNLAIKSSNSEYILLLNSDTVLVTNIIDKMVDLMENRPDSGIASCKFLKPDLRIQPTSYSFPSYWVLIFHILNLKHHILNKIFSPSLKRLIRGLSFGNLSSYLKDHEINVVRIVDVVSAACMLIRRKAIEEVGYCDENYFFGPDDYDLCIRVKEKGWKIYLVPEMGIIHFVGETSKQVFGSPLPIKLYDGWFYFFKKHDKYFKKQRFIFFTFIIPIILKLKFILVKINNENRGSLALKNYNALIKLSKSYAK